MEAVKRVLNCQISHLEVEIEEIEQIIARHKKYLADLEVSYANRQQELKDIRQFLERFNGEEK